jgi:hypothetical protein
MTATFNLFKYVQAMGATSYSNREPSHWWKVSDLESGGDEKWKEETTKNPLLIGVLDWAISERNSKIAETEENYDIDNALASELTRTYIGFNPKYGAYIGQLSPYLSQGWRFGPDHVRIWGKDKWQFFMIKKGEFTQKHFEEKVNEKVNEYNDKFKIQLEPSDLALFLKKPPKDEANIKKGKGKGRGPAWVTEKVISSLDSKNPEVGEFLAGYPVPGPQNQWSINSKGWLKILKQLMGKWYSEVIKDESVRTGKTIDQLEKEMVYNPNPKNQLDLRKIYKKTKIKMESEQPENIVNQDINVPNYNTRDRSMVPDYNDRSTKFRAGSSLYFGTLTEEASAPSMLGAFKVAQDKIKIYSVPVDFKNYDSDFLTALKEAKYEREHPEEAPAKAITDETGTVTSVDNQEELAETEQDKEKSEELEIAEEIENAGTEELGAAGNLSGDFPITDLTPVEEVAPEKIPTAETPVTKTPKTIKKPAKKTAPRIKKIEKEPVDPLVSYTLKNLTKIAAELDNDGKGKEAEEVHKVIRKYMEKQ